MSQIEKYQNCPRNVRSAPKFVALAAACNILPENEHSPWRCKTLSEAKSVPKKSHHQNCEFRRSTLLEHHSFSNSWILQNYWKFYPETFLKFHNPRFLFMPARKIKARANCIVSWLLVANACCKSVLAIKTIQVAKLLYNSWITIFSAIVKIFFFDRQGNFANR